MSKVILEPSTAEPPVSIGALHRKLAGQVFVEF